MLESAGSEKRYKYAKLLLAMFEDERGNETMNYAAGFTGRNEKEAERRMIHIMKGTGKLTKKATVTAAIFLRYIARQLLMPHCRGLLSG